MTVLSLSPALIVDDDPQTQQRLTRLLIEICPTADVTVASTPGEANAMAARIGFAVSLIEVKLLEELSPETRSHLSRRKPDARVLVTSSRGSEEKVLMALRAGAHGHLLKERNDLELTVSLRSIQHGGAPIDPMVVRRLLELLPERNDRESLIDSVGLALSAREREVLQLLAKGCSNRELAECLALSRLTVEGYLKTIFRKLGVTSRTAAVFEAHRLGLLSKPR